MKVLVLAHNDSNNIMIANIVNELIRRKHQVRIFSVFLDHRSIRMFNEAFCSIKDTREITDKDIAWCDCILSALRAHINLSALGDKVFSKRYIFIYNNYLDNTWYTAGADFMFTCGRTRHMKHEEDCASMPIGCPKNDHYTDTLISENTNNFLFIDSGHYPFSHLGKVQIVRLLLSICDKFPNYTLTVKPRFLPSDGNMLHANYDHIYSLINEETGGEIPENLILLMEHRDMQELIDEAKCVLMLCTSAYVDVALRNKPMIIIDGVDNDDKYELRNAIEYKNIYDLRRKSGCVVDYTEVLNYLPDGICCSEAHLNELVEYRTDASGKICDVMEYIVNRFLKKNVFPEIDTYYFGNYKEQMQVSTTLDWDQILHKRIKNMGNNTLNLFNRIVAPINIDRYISAIDNEYLHYDTNADGAKQFLAYLDKLHDEILVDNTEKLMIDQMDQAELYRAMFRNMNTFELFLIPQKKILCKEVYYHYTGLLYVSEGNKEEGIKRLIEFIFLTSERRYAKYDCENWYGYRDAYERIIRFYDGENLDDETVAKLFIILFEKHCENHIKDSDLRKFTQHIITVNGRFIMVP